MNDSSIRGAISGTIRLRIDLAYDGSRFRGFARQPDVPTVQGTLEGALTRVCGLIGDRREINGLPVRDAHIDSTCAGRTDAGVHALAQVVHVDIDPTWTSPAATLVQQALSRPDVVRRRLDDIVGPAITVWSTTVVDATFDARFSAVQRRYRYVVTDSDRVDPRRRMPRWDVGHPLDVDAMHRAAQAVAGEHDFISLCRRAAGRHSVRRIDEIAVERHGLGDAGLHLPPSEIHVILRGKAFCHQQVRAITGCLVEIGMGVEPVSFMAEVLTARDRSVAARVAPAHGLTLEGVGYGDDWPDAPLLPAAGD